MPGGYENDKAWSLLCAKRSLKRRVETGQTLYLVLETYSPKPLTARFAFDLALVFGQLVVLVASERLHEVVDPAAQ